MMMQATRTIPIVFVQVIDPVGSGFVKRLARPGGNVTGFTPFEYSLAGKWVELLRQITPDVSEMESEIAAFAGSPNGGLVVTVGGTATHRDLIIALAAKHRLPAAISSVPAGSSRIGPIRSTNTGALLVTSIVEKPADLPVQTPTK